MNLDAACKKSPTGIARRVHIGPRGEEIPIVASVHQVGAIAYPPALSDKDAFSRPAKAAEHVGFEDWQPMGVATAPAPPPPMCTNCMADGMTMNQVCSSCGVKGCVQCVKGRYRECDACHVANGHGILAG